MRDKARESGKGKGTPPAAGERRAMGGYLPQYVGAAGLVLEALRRGTLQWLRVADPEAGAMDDLQIASPGRLDAYQFKWSGYAGPFTFNDLVGPTPESSITRVLADGWTLLRQL